MAPHNPELVKPYDGSLPSAAGILAVEHATFGESPYTAEEVRVMLHPGAPLAHAVRAGPCPRAADGHPMPTAGRQTAPTLYAWLAMSDAGAGGIVVGFVIAFATSGAGALRWEIDLLAVHPDWRGRGLGGRLIETALAGGSALAAGAGSSPPKADRRPVPTVGQQGAPSLGARAVVADDNPASIRAFVRSGFRLDPQTCELLIYRPQEQPVRNPPRFELVVREETLSATTLLSTEQDGHTAGFAELIEVQTLLYRGIWIENLRAPDHLTCRVLIHHGIRRARHAGLDEIGAMVPNADWRLRRELRASGFRSLGRFRWLVASLPLSGTQPAG